MILRSLFRNTVCILPFLLAADPGAPAGGGGAPDATCPEPTGSTLEEKFSSAWSMAKDFFKQLSGAMSERDTAVGELAGTKQEVTDLTTERDGLKTQVTDLTTERDGLKTTVTGLTTERDTAKSRVTLIESFCKGKGIDLAGIEKSTAVKEVPGAESSADGKALHAEYQRLKATDGKKATAFLRKHKAELNEYAASLN